MKQLYYSEITGETYDSEEKCLAAEQKAAEEKAKREQALVQERARKEALASQRKERAAEIENARKEMVTAQKKYRDLIEQFVKDYHSYHYTTTSSEDIPTLFDVFNRFF